MKKYTKKYDKRNKNTKFIKKNLKKHKNRRNKTQKNIVRKNNRVKSNTYKTIQNGGAGTAASKYCYMTPLEKPSSVIRKAEICHNNIINIINRYFDNQCYYLNPGNYCYAISTMQLLRNIKEILYYINNLESKKNELELEIGNIALTENEKKIKKEKIVIFNNILPELKTKINPDLKILNGDYLKSLIEICFPNTEKKPNNSIDQQDAPEFLRKLNVLDYIQELQFYLGIEYYDNDNKFLKQRTNDRNKQDIEYNVFLTLELPDSNNSGNIQEIFEHNQKSEIFSKGNEPKISILPLVYANSKTPFYFIKPNNNYLILQLKLFTSDNIKIVFNITKIDDNLCIRELSDIDLKDTNPNIQFVNGKSVNYELISISCQLGNENSGHYANFSKQIIKKIDIAKPKWVYYNDTYSNNSAINDTQIFINNKNLLKYIINDTIGVNYIENENDINLLNQNYYSPYLLLYKRI